jgi:hypothetical protein
MNGRVRDLARRLREAERLLGWRLPVTSVLWEARPRFLVFARDLSRPLPEIRSSQVSHWTALTEVDIPTIGAVDPAMTPIEVERRLADGQECHLGWIGLDLAHYRWETSRPTLLTYLGKTLRPLPGQICGCGAFTAQPYRRRGIHTEAAIRGLYRKRARGARTAIHFVAWWHVPSHRVYVGRLGASEAGSIGYWNLGLRRRYFATKAVRLDPPTSFCIDV